MKKFIMIYALLFIVNAKAQEIDTQVCIERITQELNKVKDEAAQKYDACAKHKAALLSGQGQEYQAARHNWFRNNCANNDGSSTCKQAAQMLQDALAHLQKSDFYAQNYLPELESYHLNAQKYYALQHMFSVVQQPEQLNPGIDSVQGRMLYAVDCMKANAEPKPSKLWLEFAYDREAVNRRAQKELRDFVGNMES